MVSVCAILNCLKDGFKMKELHRPTLKSGRGVHALAAMMELGDELTVTQQCKAMGIDFAKVNMRVALMDTPGEALSEDDLTYRDMIEVMRLMRSMGLTKLFTVEYVSQLKLCRTHMQEFHSAFPMVTSKKTMEADMDSFIASKNATERKVNKLMRFMEAEDSYITDQQLNSIYWKAPS